MAKGSISIISFIHPCYFYFPFIRLKCVLMACSNTENAGGKVKAEDIE